MALFDFLDKFVGPDGLINLKTCGVGANASDKYKTLAIEASIELIAKTISRAEFQTFEEGKEVKKTNYYMLNVEANKNTSAFLFWKETIKKLLDEGEALILIKNKQLYLADSFTRKEHAFDENTYTDIKIKNQSINEIWHERQVLYLKHDNSQIKSAINETYIDFKKLIASSIKGYQNSKSRKGTYEINTSFSKLFDDETAMQEYIAALLKDFMDPEKDAVLPETNGAKYTEIDKSKGSKSNDSGRETKNFIDDIFNFIAMGFGIPPSLLKGDTVDTKDAVNNFLTFCINPIAKLITDEINRKMYGAGNYIKNTYAKLDTTKIKAVDLRDIANSIDLLNRNAALTIDDILRTLGKEPIGGDVGAMRFVTKNLELLDNVLENGEISNLKGGD